MAQFQVFLGDALLKVKVYWDRSMRKNEEIISNLNQKPKLYRLPRLWVYCRFFYPFVFSTLFFIFLIVAFTAWNMPEGHLVLGSIISLLSSLSVVASYIMIIPWRKHPSSLILYRSLTSVIFSVNIILNAISVNKSSCRNFAVVNEWMLLAGEAWLTTIAMDLVSSVTNPFTSYKANIQRYTAMVWGLTSIIGFIFYFNVSCQSNFDSAICWINIHYHNASCLWGYYLIWVILMYCYQVWASLYAYFRLLKGLPATFEIRKKCALETFQMLASYAVYLSIVMFFFIIVATNPSAKPGTSMNNFDLLVLFVIANKGSVDGGVWFMIHSFDLKTSPKSTSNKPVPVPTQEINDIQYNPILHDTQLDVEKPETDEIDKTNRDENNRNTPRSAKILSRLSHMIPAGADVLLQDEIQKIQKNLTKTITEIADLAIEDVDEGDLSPQVNLALRQQIVQYVTSGVKESIQRMSPNKVDIFNKVSATDRINRLVRARPDKAIVEGLQVTEFLLDNELPFKSFAPDLFREIRQQEGIDDEYYLELLSSPANERLSEGASGAFMFFCGNGEFIVKTIRSREARVLHQSLPLYTSYLRKNTGSLLCRFLGSYSLAVYSQTFYFVIMRNCFDPCADINERYDIKGSWVGRSADPGKTKKRATCRHCNTYFVPSKKEACSVIVGRHEANIVLKDNDMRTKISLQPDVARNMLEILMKDSDLLGKLGVIDYSLLVGVKKWKFPVELTDEEIEKTKKPKKGSAAVHKSAVQPSFKAYSVSGPAVYYFGIVDFLQDWTFNKRVERVIKIYCLRKDPDGLSVMEPMAYKLRFQRKMKQIFDLSNDARHMTTIMSREVSGSDRWSHHNSSTLVMIEEEKIEDEESKLPESKLENESPSPMNISKDKGGVNQDSHIPYSSTFQFSSLNQEL